MTIQERLRAEAGRRGLEIKHLKAETEVTAPVKKRYSEFCPFEPIGLQPEYIANKAKHLLFGGGAGAAKSFAALMDISLDVEKHPIYVWVIRRHKVDMKSTNGIYFNARLWWEGTRAKKGGEDGVLQYYFPSGAVVQFLAIDNIRDLDKIQGNSAHKIVFEEMQQFEPEYIDFCKPRLRKEIDLEYETNTRGTANPGGPAHDYLVKVYGILDPSTRKVGHDYLHGTYLDNPKLDQKDYEKQFEDMEDPVMRARMQYGDWSAITAGKYARDELFKIIRPDEVPPMVWHARGHDIGITGTGDATTSHLMVRQGPRFYVLDEYHHEVDTPTVEKHVLAKMRTDPNPTIHAFENQTLTMPVMQRLEQETYIERVPWEDEDNWRRLEIYTSSPDQFMSRSREAFNEKIRFTPVPCRGDKLTKCSLFFEALWSGNVYLVEGPWNDPFKQEFIKFRNMKGDKDDRIDSVGNASRALMRLPDKRHEIVLPLIPGTDEHFRKYLELNGLLPDDY